MKILISKTRTHLKFPKPMAMLTLILTVMMFLPMLASCADNKNGTGETTAVTTAAQNETTGGPAETKPVPDLPNIKYPGYVFNVANDFADATKYTTNAIKADNLTGEPINDALYERARLLEEKFGVTIVDNNVDLDAIKNSIAAGDDLYTIATVDLSHIMEMVNAGYTMDFYDIGTIDLSKPWWDHNAEVKLSFDGKLYYTFSDFLITGLDNARATYFNKPMVTNLGLESPYSLVTSGKWTIEKMKEMATAAVSDTNGDGKYNSSDNIGIANNATTFYEAMLTGCNAEIVKQGSDGIPYFCCFDERDFFVGVYQKLLGLFTSDNCYFITDTDTGRNMFINGQLLFTVDTLLMASKSRQEDIDFGILPIVKYSESQENYLQVSPNPHSIMVPSVTVDADRTGVLLEALSYYSSVYYSDSALIPSYYELALKSKSATDSESADMLTLIHDNISYVIKIVGTDFSNMIYSYFSVNKTDIASLIEKQEAAQRKLLETTIANMK
jgi:hypothetical protein